MSGTKDWVIEISTEDMPLPRRRSLQNMETFRIGDHLLLTALVKENRFYVDLVCQAHRDCILDPEQLRVDKVLLIQIILAAGYHHAVQYSRCKIGRI